MRVKELSERAGVAPHVIRYYTRLGLLRPTRERRNDYRAFAESDVHRVRFIRRARWLGFTLSDVENILANADGGVSPCPEVREIIALRVRENRLRRKAVNRLQQRMEQSIAMWTTLPDRLPTHESLCYLIERVSQGDELLT